MHVLHLLLVDVLLLHVSWACPSHLPGWFTSRICPHETNASTGHGVDMDYSDPTKAQWDQGLHLSWAQVLWTIPLDCSLCQNAFCYRRAVIRRHSLQLDSALFEVASERLYSNYSLKPRVDDDCGAWPFHIFWFPEARVLTNGNTSLL